MKKRKKMEVKEELVPNSGEAKEMFDEQKFQKWLFWVGGLGIFLFFTLLLWGTVSASALWDDKFLMMHPAYLREGMSLQTVMGPVLTNPALFWRPVGMFTLAAQFDLGGNMLPVKQANVLLYALGASLFFIVLLKLLWMAQKSLPLLNSTGKRGIEWLSFGALMCVFVVFLNPSMLQSIHWISGRFILLAGALMFLSFAILLYGGVQSKKGRALSVLLFFLALCSYEGVLLTVPVYVAVLYWLLRTHQEGTLEERIGVWNPRVLGGVGAAFLVYVLLRWYSLGAPVRLEPGFVSASYLKDIFEWFADAFSAQIQISGGTPLEGLTAYAWFLFWLAVAWSMRFCVGFYQKSLNEFYRLKQEKQKLVTVETVNDKNYQIFLATMNEQIAHSVKIVSFGRFALWLWGALLLAGFLGTVVVRLWTPKESDLLWGPDLLLFAPLMLGSLLLCLIFMLHMCASVVQYFVAKMDLVKQFNAAVESQEASTEGPKEFVQNARVFKNDASGIVRWSKNGLFIVLTTLSFLAFLQITKGIYATQELKGRWSNDVALWESAYQKDEKSALAVTNYLIALNKTGASLEQLTKVGEPHWEQLAKKESLTRIEAASIATYGALLNEKNEFGKALGMLSLALVKSASEPLLALNLAHIAVQKERWQEALGALNYGLGSYKKTWFNKKQAIAMYGLRAQVYATLGDEKQSKSDLDIANALKKEFSQP